MLDKMSVYRVFVKKKIKNFTTASTDRILFKRVIYNKISATTNRQK